MAEEDAMVANLLKRQRTGENPEAEEGKESLGKSVNLVRLSVQHKVRAVPLTRVTGPEFPGGELLAPFASRGPRRPQGPMGGSGLG